MACPPPGRARLSLGVAMGPTPCGGTSVTGEVARRPDRLPGSRCSSHPAGPGLDPRGRWAGSSSESNDSTEVSSPNTGPGRAGAPARLRPGVPGCTALIPPVAPARARAWVAGDRRRDRREVEGPPEGPATLKSCDGPASVELTTWLGAISLDPATLIVTGRRGRREGGGTAARCAGSNGPPDRLLC